MIALALAFAALGSVGSAQASTGAELDCRDLRANQGLRAPRPEPRTKCMTREQWRVLAAWRNASIARNLSRGK